MWVSLTLGPLRSVKAICQCTRHPTQDITSMYQSTGRLKAYAQHPDPSPPSIGPGRLPNGDLTLEASYSLCLGEWILDPTIIGININYKTVLFSLLSGPSDARIASVATMPHLSNVYGSASGLWLGTVNIFPGFQELPSGIYSQTSAYTRPIFVLQSRNTSITIQKLLENIPDSTTPTFAASLSMENPMFRRGTCFSFCMCGYYRRGG